MDEKNSLIPKKIHYFWFSNDPMPPLVQNCISSWKKVLPDYQFIKWDLTNTDVSHPFAQKALQQKKWAFLTDYCRLNVLLKEGGIYMDTDVFLVKSFNDLLYPSSFWGQADNGLVEPVVIGAEKNNQLVKACLECFDSEVESEEFREIPKVISPVFIGKGFLLENKGIQYLENNVVFPYDYFCPMPFEKADSTDFELFATENTIAIHLWNANWFDPFRFFWNGRRKSGWKAVFKEIRKKPNQGIAFYKSVFYHLKCQLFGYPTE